MVNQETLIEALRSFATRSVEDYDLEVVLAEVGEYARRVISLDGAGITLQIRAEHVSTQFISATDSVTLHVEREQDRLGQGPCMDAITTGNAVPVEDISVEPSDRWPTYQRLAVDAGFRAVAGIPMLAAGRVVGAMNAYKREAHRWTSDDLAAAQLLANIATAYVANATAYADQATLSRQLQRALDSRIMIEQAKGILAERLKVTPDAAFEVLREHARRNRMRIHQLAEDVIVGRETLGA